MKIFKCPSCGKYTMREICNICNVPTAEDQNPLKFRQRINTANTGEWTKFNECADNNVENNSYNKE